MNYQSNIIVIQTFQDSLKSSIKQLQSIFLRGEKLGSEKRMNLNNIVMQITICLLIYAGIWQEEHKIFLSKFENLLGL